MKEKFGSLELGLKPLYKLKKEKALDAIRKVSGARLEISMKEYLDSGMLPHYTTLIRYFGSFADACEQAGVKCKNGKKGLCNRTQYTDEQMLESLLKVAGPDKFISASQYSKSGKHPHINTITYRFGSFAAACEKVGVTLIKSNRQQPMKIKRKNKDRTRKSKERQARMLMGLCPQCGLEWEEPEESSTGKKPKHCKRCQAYYKQRYLNNK
jgi:hypothetical protein